MSEETLLNHAVSKVRKFVLMIIGMFIIYHSILHLGYTTDSCKWLLSHGRYVANQNWQPFGCLMYNYNKTDCKLCLRQTATISNEKITNYFVIAGDTRMLQLYQYITDHLLSKSSYPPPRRQYHLNDTSLFKDQTFHDDNLAIKLEFLWRPFITDDLFQNINNYIMASLESSDQLKQVEVDRNKNPKLLVVGSALWNSRNNYSSSSLNEDLAFTNYMTQYKRNLTRLIPMIDKLAYKSTRILWTLQDPIDEDLIVINTTNQQIDELNYATKTIFNTLSSNRDFHLWSSSRLIADGLMKDMEKDGIHSNEMVLNYKAQILMNLYCNPMNNYEGTCCSDTRQFNLTQLIMLAMAALIVSLALIMIIRYKYSDRYRFARINMRWQRLAQQETTTINDYDDQIDVDLVNGSNQNDTSFNWTNSDDDGGGGYDLMMQAQTHQTSETPYLYSSGLDNDLIMQLAQLGAIVIFFFICDQTNFFMKENKYFTLANFLLPITYVFALGLFFTEQQQQQQQLNDGSGVNRNNNHHQVHQATSLSSSNILNKNQTDEWKGWMQLVILIYNMSNARQNLRIYMLIRILLSSYLFLTGYGHFTYFWETKDLSLNRFCKVLFRLNLLTLCLSISMNRPYQGYYFISLVSIWFIIIFVFMSISPSSAMDKFNTNDALKMFIKFSVLLISITLVYLSEVFIGRLFSLEPLRLWRQPVASFNEHGGSDINTDTDSSLQAWWLHWSIDRYSVPAGMIFSYLMWLFRVHGVLITKPSHISPEQPPDVLTQQQQIMQTIPTDKPLYLSRSTPMMIAVSLSAIGVLCYAIFASICQDRYACDEVHAYISFIPIVAFIILRNSTEFLRQRYSIFFAFFGRISLELSICQYHIWLAASTNGILILVPSYPTLNLVITSIIFITASHKLNNITSHLIHYCVQADDWRAIIRNMIVFLLVVAPISFN